MVTDYRDKTPNFPLELCTDLHLQYTVHVLEKDTCRLWIVVDAPDDIDDRQRL